jgi:hypothetical protein
MIRHSLPHLITRSEYKTEWSEWSPDPVPHVTAKWGERIMLPNPVEIKHNNFYWYETELLDQIARDNAVIYLKYGYFLWQINELKQSLAKVNEPRIVVSFCDLPGPWPDNVRLINTEPMAYQFSKAITRAGLRPKYQRRVSQLDHRFTIMAMGRDQGRHKLMLMLERLNLLANAKHSNPDLAPEQGVFTEDHLAFNKMARPLPARILGDAYVKFNVEQNLKVLPGIIEQGNFFVSIDTNPFLDDRISNITEKIMWSMTTTTPVIPIWATNKARQMAEWGFRFDNVGYRRSEETEQQAVQRWCERIMFMDRIAQDPEWAQSFEDRSGEDTAHNVDLAKRLHVIIDQSIQHQIDQLPREFQDL